MTITHDQDERMGRRDYTQESGFWTRLKYFVQKVQVNDAMSEEEKNMILHNCKRKLEQLK